MPNAWVFVTGADTTSTGVLASPIIQINPLMGANIIIVVFAVVVIGGMGSILGSILTGLGLGVIEGLTKVFYPEASSTVVFVISRDNLITGKVMCPRLLFLLVAGGLLNFVHLLTPVATMRLRITVVFLLLM